MLLKQVDYFYLLDKWLEVNLQKTFQDSVLKELHI